MKKPTCILIIILCSFFTLSAQLRQGEFAIGGIQSDAANKIFQDRDGGYVMNGTSYSYWGQSSYVIKLDSAGNKQWSRVMIGNLVGVDIIPILTASDIVNYIVLSLGNNWYSYGLTVNRLNQNGKVMWFWNISIDEDYATKIMQARDGKLYFLANDHYSITDNLLELGKIDTAGHLKWGKIIYDSAAPGIIYGGVGGLVETNDKNILIGGVLADAGLVKTDTAGQVLWAKNIGIAGDSANAIINTIDGGYAIAGSTSLGAGGRDMYVVKFDSSYNIQWAKTIGGSAYDVANSINQTTDGGYVITGGTTSFGAGGEDVYVVKLDALGNLQWSRTIGGPDYETGNSIQQTADKGYAICGTTYSFGRGNGDMYFIKLDSNGNSCSSANAASSIGSGSTVTASVTLKEHRYNQFHLDEIDTAADTISVLCNVTRSSELNKTIPSILVYPDPFNNTTTITFNENGKHFLELDDLTGRKLQWIGCNGKEYTLNRGNLADGVYFVKLFDGQLKYITTNKIIVQ